jgi:hypothetical protein
MGKKMRTMAMMSSITSSAMLCGSSGGMGDSVFAAFPKPYPPIFRY